MRRREFIAGIGGVATWPLVVRAQQPQVPVVGFLNGGTESGRSPFLGAFRQGLGEQGYIEGRNVGILFRWADYQYDRLPALAADLVGRRVAVIVATTGAAAALAAKAATTTIPIVFEIASDPVALGLVASLNRPGGNITGGTFLAAQLIAKRLEVLHQAVPAAATIAYLINPNTPDDGRISDAEAAARVLGVRLLILKATNPGEIETAFANLVQKRIGAVLADSDPLFSGQRDQIAALAARHTVPAISHVREFVEGGGLMSYGANVGDTLRLAGIYTGRILKGEKPGDLPVQQSAKVELIINLKTAKALGITFPLTLLGRADEVIE
jgi:putative tryptophan/tyrosine transport system substrate-binding protein